ncbi:MAG: DinB family protein [Azonexaceae bacterium]|nr:DinB family protein [Azonexaceae bacterium]
MSTTQLAPPGAGLPWLERWFSRTLLQTLRVFLSNGALTRWLRRETETVLTLAASLPEAQASQPVLVPRVTGLEDSSRSWSANMVLQHLVIVDTGIRELAEALADDTAFARELRIAEVKPEPTAGAEQHARLRAAVDDYARLIESLGDLRSTLRHTHPWFGQLDLRGWHTLAAMHTMAHRRQMQHIVARQQPEN